MDSANQESSYKKVNTLEGNLAPQFSLKDEEGRVIRSDALLAHGPVMLVFYPGDFTLVCTKQLCSYQDTYEKFRAYGIQIVGISHNTEASHRDFRTRYKFSFSLLSDPKKTIFREYGVTSLFMFGGTSRAVFIISSDGHIIYRHVEPTILTHRKPRDLLQVIQDLKVAGKI